MDLSMTKQRSILRPNAGQILDHIEAVAGDAMNGAFEITWNPRPKVWLGKQFDLSEIERAAAFAVNKNEEADCNLYIGAALRKHDTFPDGRAEDVDYFETGFCYVDCDEEGAVDRAREKARQLGVMPTFVVITGNHPHKRGQLWWKLEDPFRNPAVHREVMRGLALAFGGDPAVINPSRVLRIGGSIAWKVKPGREDEMTSFINVSGRAYPIAQLRAIALDAINETPSAKPKTSGLGLDTGHVGADISGLLEAAGRAGKWHDSVLRIVGSMVAKGVPDSLILALAPSVTQPGYELSQTVAEMEVMIRGAREKGWTPEPEAAPEPLTEEDRAAIPAALFKPWAVIRPEDIPPVRFAYSDFYALGYTSLTVAPPKVGKSLLGLAEAVDIASGKGFLTGEQREPQAVVYYNAEDDQSVIDARVIALCQYYGVPQEDIAGRLYATSGVQNEDFFLIAGDKGEINEPQFVSIEKFVQENGAKVLIFDPLQDLSRAPETNEVFRLLGQRIRRMASSLGVALGLVHHTRKMQNGAALTIDDARGGGALRGTSRFNRLLAPMTDEEAIKAGVESRHAYFRIGDVESNLAPPQSDNARWFEKHSIEISFGRSAPVLREWQWPDAFKGLRASDATRVQAVIGAMETPPRHDPRASNWAGFVVAKCLEWNPNEAGVKERIKALIDGWIREDVLALDMMRDTRAGRDAQVVIVGGNIVRGD